MIHAGLQDARLVESLHPRLKMLFDYVREHDLSQVPARRIVLDNDNVFINVADATLIAPEKQKLEVHRAYLDVHIPLTNTEIIGWRALSDIDVPPESPFDVAADAALYRSPAAAYLTVHPGEFFMAWPQDAHAPLIGSGTLRKLIAKVKLTDA